MAEDGEQRRERQEFSWARMLVLIGAGFLAAGAIAYRLVAPFFHVR